MISCPTEFAFVMGGFVTSTISGLTISPGAQHQHKYMKGIFPGGDYNAPRHTT